MNSIPFYANTPDDTHCFQAALRMILKYYFPDKEYTWTELEKFTAKKEGLWTWVTQGIINMRKLGFEVILREVFDYQKFIEKGGEYLLEKNGLEVSIEQIEHSDIAQEQKIANEYIRLFGNRNIPATITELKTLIDKKYIIIANVNANKLNGKQGYTGHFVVIYSYDQNNLFLHDPGLPPKKARKVLLIDFMKAWEYPTRDSKGFIAFKLTK